MIKPRKHKKNLLFSRRFFSPGEVGLEPMTSGFGAEQSFDKKLNKTSQLGTCRYSSRRRFSDETLWKDGKPAADKMKRKKNMFTRNHKSINHNSLIN